MASECTVSSSDSAGSASTRSSEALSENKGPAERFGLTRGETRPLSDFGENHVWDIAEYAPDGMILVDENGQILFVNRQIEAMFCYDRGELLGKSVDELLPDRLRTVHSAHRTRYRVEPTTRSMGVGMELRACRKNGSEFPVEVSLGPVTEPDAGVAVIASVRDITDRVVARAHALRINSAIDATGDGIFIFSAETYRFLYVNQGGIEQSGYETAELLTMTPLHLAPEFTKKTLKAMLRPLLEGETRRIPFRTILRPKDGADISIDVVLDVPHPGEPAGERFVVAVVRDVTEQVAAEQRLRDSESTFHTLFDSAPIGILTMVVNATGDWVIERANAAVGQIFGHDPGQLVGKPVQDFTGPADRPTDTAGLQHEALGRKGPRLSERRYVRSDGFSGWLQLHAVAMESGRVLTHAVEITDRKIVESHRESQQRWLEGLAEIRQLVLDEASLENVLSLVVQYALEIANADVGAIGTPDSSGEFLILGSKHGTRPHSNRSMVRILSSIRAVLDFRQTLAFDRHSDNADDGFDDDFGPTILAPFLSGRDVAGVLMLSRKPGSEPFNETEVSLIESFVNQASVATQLVEARKERQRLAVLDDRARIAQNMQDLVIQRLFGAGIALQSIASAVPEGKPAEKLHTAVEEIDTAIRELREAIFRFHQTEES